METSDFFDLVLPRQGFRCLAVPKTSGGYQHLWYTSNGAAAEAALKIDAAGKTCFVAVSGFATKESRKGENVQAVRSLILDLDVGENKPYATQAAALKGLQSFLRAVGLPRPLLVSSGYGIHCWFVLDDDIDPELWRETASLLKAAAAHQGLGADPSRTSDIASVLRPTGTHNHKGSPPKLVEVLGAVPPAIDYPELHATLEQYCEKAGVTPRASSGPAPSQKVPVNDDLRGGMERQPAWAENIAEKCAVLALMRDTQGNVDQPTWYHSLGVIAFCEDAETVAHAWSRGHPAYSEGETSTKLAQAGRFAPTTCSKLADFQPSLCAACPYRGKITSPISLGYEDVVAPVAAPLAAMDPLAALGQTISPPELKAPPFMPQHYSWEDNKDGQFALCYKPPSDDPDDQPKFSFIKTLIYPVVRLHDGDRYITELVAHCKGEEKRISVPTSTIAEGGRALAKALGDFEVVAEPRMSTHLDAYLQRWVHQLRENTDETRLQQHFGWTEDREFVMGDRIIGVDGERAPALQGMAAGLATALTPKGSYAVWRDVIDRAYNVPGQEDYQYLVLLSFAAPLFAMFRQYGGITVYAHSEGSGAGKTTAQRAGLAAWGDWEALQMSDKKVTTNMLWANIGAMHNLPVLYDELTNLDNETASDLVFSISSGRQKQRMAPDGSPRKNNVNWSTILMANGNNLISEKLAIHRTNAEAELSRLFEFTMTARPHLTPNQASELFPLLMDNYGHAGIRFARFLVENYDAVEAKLNKALQAFNSMDGVTQVERYWAALQSSVIVALKLCRTLDIVQFDEVAMLKWIVAHMGANRVTRQDSVTLPLEQIGTMLGDLWDGVLVTEGEGDLRTKPPTAATVLKDPRGVMVGRAIVSPDKSNERTVLLLSVTAVRDWCNKRGVSAREMFNAAVAAGWVEQGVKKYALGRGTRKYTNITGYIPCWVVDPIRMGAGAAGIGERLTAIKGGRAADGSGDT